MIFAVIWGGGGGGGGGGGPNGRLFARDKFEITLAKEKERRRRRKKGGFLEWLVSLEKNKKPFSCLTSILLCFTILCF